MCKSSECDQCTSAPSVIAAWRAFTCSLSKCADVLKVTPLEKCTATYTSIKQFVSFFDFHSLLPNLDVCRRLCSNIEILKHLPSYFSDQTHTRSIRFCYFVTGANRHSFCLTETVAVSRWRTVLGSLFRKLRSCFMMQNVAQMSF